MLRGFEPHQIAVVREKPDIKFAIYPAVLGQLLDIRHSIARTVRWLGKELNLISRWFLLIRPDIRTIQKFLKIVGGGVGFCFE